MLKACRYCGRIHDKKFDCPAKLRTMRERDAVTREREREIRAFRSSAAWRRKSEMIKLRDGRLCLICRDELQRFHTKTGAVLGTEVHHIVPLSVDFSARLDDSNLITLCRIHHERAEAGKYPQAFLKALVRAVSAE